MAITATNTATNFEVVPAGMYVARCYSMVHIGTIKELIKGKEVLLNKVRISWELPTEKKEFKEGEGEKPMSVSKEFTLSMNEKANLRKFLEGWRGQGFTEEQAKSFDVTKLLGQPCMLSIIHKTSGKGNLYADISSCTVIMKGMICPPQINPMYEFTYESFDDKKFAALPDFLKKKMMDSIEYKKLMQPHHTETPASSGGDDLPF